MKNIFSIIFLVLIGLLPVFNVSSQSTPINYLKTAEEFITALKDNLPTENYIKTFELCKLDLLSKQVETDDQKVAFWVNIYNSYIQVILQKYPEKYDNRSQFFNEKQINIGGVLLSFANIEHGILRRSQHPFFLGYLTKFFPSATEKMLRVSKRNWRIHFALNCGAKSCPPVAAYDWAFLDDQLDKSARAYLSKYTTYVAEENTAYVTPLFSWFRGDFGGLEGIKDIIKGYDLIPKDNTRLKTINYDWTLDLGNFIVL